MISTGVGLGNACGTKMGWGWGPCRIRQHLQSLPPNLRVLEWLLGGERARASLLGPPAINAHLFRALEFINASFLEKPIDFVAHLG